VLHQGAYRLMYDKHKQIGSRLKWARARAEMTIRDVARLANVASSAVTEIEQGTRIPRADTLERLAAAVKVPGCWLVFGDGPAPKGWTG
jgi:transcriptional regulator with XRE-family HTH domain